MRRGLLVLVAAAMLLVGASRGSAQPASVVVDDAKPTLTGAVSAQRTVTIGLTNLTSTTQPVAITTSITGCGLGVNPTSLGPAQHTSVTVTVPATCAVPEAGLDLSVSAGGGPALSILAKPASSASTSWAWLWVFPISLGGLVVIAVLLYFVLAERVQVPKKPKGKTSKKGRSAGPPAQRSSGDQIDVDHRASEHQDQTVPKQEPQVQQEPQKRRSLAAWVSAVLKSVWRNITRPPRLPYLDKTFSFKDSWAGNVTIIGGILTGVFGAGSVVKSLLGKDADSIIALATVGAAISVAFIAAGPIVMLSTKAGKEFTFFGLLIAAAVTLSGAAGQLVVVSVVASKLDFGGAHVPGLGWILGITGTSLLALYSVRSIHEIVQDGVTPPQLGDSDAVKAAKLVAAALRAATPVANTTFDIDVANPPQYLLTSPGDDRPRRAATL